MVFPLLFPSDDLGWSIGYDKKPIIEKEIDYNLRKKESRKLENITENSDIKNSNDLTTLQYYSYRLSYRPEIINFSPLVFAGRLTKQYFLQALIMVESNRMNFFFFI